jgi:hypothetical protein
MDNKVTSLEILVKEITGMLDDITLTLKTCGAAPPTEEEARDSNKSFP